MRQILPAEVEFRDTGSGRSQFEVVPRSTASRASLYNNVEVEGTTLERVGRLIGSYVLRLTRGAIGN